MFAVCQRIFPGLPGLFALFLGAGTAWAQLPPLVADEDPFETPEPEPLPISVPRDLFEPTVKPGAGSADRFARMFSADLRDIEERQSEILGKLDQLPRLIQSAMPEQFGYHSGQVERRQKWVQIDLGERVEPDAVVLFPVTVQIDNEPVLGYGFPRRFRIDISDDPAFGDYKYETIVDQRDSSRYAPREAPFYFEAKGLGGRYVRVTPITMWRPDDDSGAEDEVFALAEVMVLKGERNIAHGKTVTALDWSERGTFWSRRFLTDSRTPLGIPAGLEDSPSLGFRCENPKAETRWVQVDLGESMPVSEVRLIPASAPQDVPEPLLEFPPQFKIEVSDSPDMSQADPVVKVASGQLARPGNQALVFPVVSGYGRYVRFTAERRGAGELRFALAEMQIFSENQNVARDKTVTAEESVESGGWSRKALVDGFSSRSDLPALSPWLENLAARADLIREWREKEQQRIDLVESTVSKGFRWIGSGSGGLLLLIIVGSARGRTRRRRELEGIRQQIASDLHDDIGSNLSSIALLAELGSSEADEPELVREELGEIKRTADKTVESMRDIVWLIRPGEETWKQMIARFRETAAKLLRTHEYQFETRGAMHEERLPLDFKRDLFLMYKEILNNIVRHAHAKRVEIDLEIRRGRVLLSIVDDGQGFDTAGENFREGNGLKNLRRRAQALGGILKVKSAAGEGTSIQLSAPMP